MARLLEGIQFSPDCFPSPDGKLLLARPSDLVKLIRIDNGVELLSIASPFEERAFWSPDSSRFALAGWSDIRVLLTGYIKSCAFSPDNEYLTVATERAVHLYQRKGRHADHHPAPRPRRARAGHLRPLAKHSRAPATRWPPSVSLLARQHLGLFVAHWRCEYLLHRGRILRGTTRCPSLHPSPHTGTPADRRPVPSSRSSAPHP